MMMCLGLFVFSLDTAAYQEFERQMTWRHGKNARVGARPTHQYVGEGDDIITLTGWIAPELAGTALSLDALREMASTGREWILIRGTGRIYGSYIINEITEKQTYFEKNGDAKKIEFTVKLERTGDDVLTMAERLGDITSISQLADMAGITALADRARDAAGRVQSIVERFQ